MTITLQGLTGPAAFGLLVAAIALVFCLVALGIEAIEKWGGR